MPQSIFVQVGQCGNQCGFQFWYKAAEEYAFYRDKVSEEDICHFFRPLQSCSIANVKQLTECYNARAVLIDMEEGVINEGCRGPLKHLFSKNQILTDVSGSGNNWAVGNKVYGAKHMDSMMNLFRREAEYCDSLQCFLLTFSMGGGTGSGLGTAALEYLHSEFPKIPRLVFAVFPSIIDDVVTSPYNAVLANSKLIEFASCVIPFDNKALNDMCLRMDKIKQRAFHFGSGARPKTACSKDVGVLISGSKPFDDMNNLIAHAVLETTSSSRFPGTLNIDLNDIFVNMTPFPKLHYLISSIAPMLSTQDDSKIDRLFTDLFSDSHHLFECSLRKGIVLSSAVLGRGQVTVSDIQKNINRLSDSFKFAPWNENGWKLGLCNVPPVNRTRSLFMLANSTEITTKFCTMKEKFIKMYEKKAHVHHFSEVDSDIKNTFEKAIGDLTNLITEYKSLESVNASDELPRPSIL